MTVNNTPGERPRRKKGIDTALALAASTATLAAFGGLAAAGIEGENARSRQQAAETAQIIAYAAEDDFGDSRPTGPTLGASVARMVLNLDNCNVEAEAQLTRDQNGNITDVGPYTLRGIAGTFNNWSDLEKQVGDAACPS